MLHLIDTNIAIHLRDGDARIGERVASLPALPAISVVTRVELEGGVHRDLAETVLRRARLDLLLEDIEELPFTTSEAEAYGRIIEQLGYSRGKLLDRMIGATALTHEMILATLNPRDFRAIRDLMIEDWSS